MLCILAVMNFNARTEDAEAALNWQLASGSNPYSPWQNSLRFRVWGLGLRFRVYWVYSKTGNMQ